MGKCFAFTSFTFALLDSLHSLRSFSLSTNPEVANQGPRDYATLRMLANASHIYISIASSLRSLHSSCILSPMLILRNHSIVVLDSTHCIRFISSPHFGFLRASTLPTSPISDRSSSRFFESRILRSPMFDNLGLEVFKVPAYPIYVLPLMYYLALSMVTNVGNVGLMVWMLAFRASCIGSTPVR